MERFGVQGISFIIQIIIARILEIEYYGALSLMIAFTSIANVFIQTGFNSSLIQNKDVEDEDYSSVFWITLMIAIFLYTTLFFAAPGIFKLYNKTFLVRPFRVLATILIIGAFNSIQLAKVTREMNFKKMFFSNILATLVSGIVGIAMAIYGYGLWALVAQSILNLSISTIVMFYTVNWRPRMICNVKRLKELFSYGWKLMLASLLDTSYQELQSLVIGKKYDSAILAYHDKGKRFPQFIMNAINGTVQSVMLPAMSEKQDSSKDIKSLMQGSIALCSYIFFPLMIGLASIAEPIVKIVLTDKWLPCVPYLQIFCFNYALFPVHSCNLQAINAIGRSDLFLKLELIKKAYGMIFLVIAVVCFRSPLAIAMMGLFTTLISWFVNAYPNKRLIGYSYKEQVMDLLPSYIMSIIMGGTVYFMRDAINNEMVGVLVQIIIGIFVYLLLSIVLKPYPYRILMELIKRKTGSK